MANNGVSQHFKIDGGLDVSSDSQFATLGANTKIVYKPNSEKYIKNPNYSNVFDKAKSFATDEELSDTKTELGTVKSKSITAIGDADKTSGVCSCKNASGSEVDTFTCHVSKTANNPTLSWGETKTIGTIDGTTFKVTMPANPNTDTKAEVVNKNPTLSWGETKTIGTVDGAKLEVTMPANPNTDTTYKAGTGLSLSGNYFNVNIPNYKVSDGANPDETYIMTLDVSQTACHPSQYTIGNLIDKINNAKPDACNNRIEEQGNQCIRYSNGLQICWGIAEILDKDGVVNFPKAFSAHPSVTVTHFSDSAFYYHAVISYNGYFEIHCNGTEQTVYWFAIGTWK